MLDLPAKTIQYALATTPLLLVLHWELHSLSEHQRTTEMLLRQILATLNEKSLDDDSRHHMSDYHFVDSNE